MTEARNFSNSSLGLSEEEFILRLENVATFESLSSYPPHSSAYRFSDGSLLRVFHSISIEESVEYFNTPNSSQSFSWSEV